MIKHQFYKRYKFQIFALQVCDKKTNSLKVYGKNINSEQKIIIGNNHLPEKVSSKNIELFEFNQVKDLYHKHLTTGDDPQRNSARLYKKKHKSNPFYNYIDKVKNFSKNNDEQENANEVYVSSSPNNSLMNTLNFKNKLGTNNDGIVDPILSKSVDVKRNFIQKKNSSNLLSSNKPLYTYRTSKENSTSRTFNNTPLRTSNRSNLPKISDKNCKNTQEIIFQNITKLTCSLNF